jgi:hypothetical protein
VAQQLAKEVGQEVGEDLLFREGVRLARGEQVGPVRQFRAKGVEVGRQPEPLKVVSKDIGAKQRLGFDGHGRASLWPPF